MSEIEHLCEDLKRRAERMGCARSAVEAVGDGIEFVLAVQRQVGALGQVLAQQPIGVLAGAALPRAVGVAEVDLHARLRGQVCVARHLFALVVGQALAQRGGNRIELKRPATHFRLELNIMIILLFSQE